MNDPEKRKLRGKKRIKISNRPMRVFAAMIKRFHFLIMYNPNLYRKQHFNASVPVDLLKNITVSELDFLPCLLQPQPPISVERSLVFERFFHCVSADGFA